MKAKSIKGSSAKEIKTALQKSLGELKDARLALAAKNRELEIEAALEKVRAVAMGMNKPKDMLDVCKTISIQLQSLGVKEIRNVQTAIFYESRGTYINYEYYAKHRKTIITETSYTNHKISKAFAAQMLKGKGEIFITHIKGKKVKDWIAYQKTTNVFIDKYLNKASSLNYYWHSLGPVALGISTYMPLGKDELNLFKRFLNVFELAYTRYLDIEQAIAQVYEAKIEASLEKVRAQALGMHKPGDLLNVCKVLFKELSSLGFEEMRNAIIHTFNDEKKYFLDYDYSDLIGGVITNIPYSNDPVIKRFLRQIRKSDEAFVEDTITGKELNEWKKFRKSGGQPDDPRLNKTSALYYYFYSIGTGSIGISTFSSINEEKLQLLKRFRNVFDFAYRRYMDVAQAEAQAYEAKIEASLERMRAVAMSMRKSEELITVCEAMYKELTALGFEDIRNAQISIKNPDNLSYFVSEYSDHVSIAVAEAPLDSSPLVKNLYEEMERSDDAFYQREYSGKDFENWRKWRMSIDAAIDPRITEATSMWFYLYSIGSGYLGISTFHAISNEKIEVLKRFRNVFELSYRRYMDVAQAEAQARESQIQLALERVRARTMAMQKSDELPETSYLLFQQLKELGETAAQLSIGTIKEEEKFVELSATLHGSQMLQTYKIPIDEPHVMKKVVKAFKEKQKSLMIEIRGKKLNDYNDWRNSILKTKIVFREKQWIIHVVFFSKGFLSFSSDQQRPKEAIELLERFASVFDLTYTRFLDLKNAEAQAKEARVELALERVRARAMAMKHSDELAELVATVFKELTHLDFSLTSCIIWIHDHEHSSNTLWIASAEMNEPAQPFQIKPFHNDFFKSIVPAWKAKDPKWIYALTGSEKKTFEKAFFKEIPNLPDALRKALKTPKQVVFSASFNNFGALEIVETEALTDEKFNILHRFGKVFDSSYTRFNDLKQAEAQAREAKIEAALERVRSNTMAMHHSEELKEVISVTFEQLKSLNITIDSCVITLFIDGSNDLDNWVASAEQKYPQKIRVPYFKHPLFDKIVLAKNKPGSFFTLHLSQKENQIFYKHVLENSDFGKIINEDRRKLVMNADSNIMSFANFQHTGLRMGNFRNHTYTQEENNTILRFAAVFEQTYTRFLDLQKAEAQAREARIEAALERVRAKAMAMHSSKDLSETISVFYRELKSLSIAPRRCGVALMDKDVRMAEVTTMNTTELGDSIEVIGHIKMGGHKILDDVYENWLIQKEYHAVLRGNQIKEYYQVLKPQISYPDYPHDVVQYGYYFMFKEGDVYAWTEQELTENELEIYRRFTTVISLTYKRYIDLQKAEAQARESQIQLALERVRARTMAMQRSEELSETAYVLFQQFVQLGENPIQITIGIVKEEERIMEFRVTDWGGSGSKVNIGFNVSIDEPTLIHKIFKAWKKNESSIVIELVGTELEGWLSYRNKVSGVNVKSTDTAGRRVISVAFFSKGMIAFSSPLPPVQESVAILERFANVFDGTYTRFLDLQKAEAQAREAQIETALERVRSRSMAMQKSEELKEVIQAVYDQFIHLNIHIEHTGFLMDYKARDDMHIWLADQHLVPSEVTIPYFDSPPNNSIKEAKEKGQDFFTYHLTFEEKNKFYRDLFKFVPGVPEETLEYYFNCPGLAGSGVLLDNIGLYIENFSGTPYTDEENNTLMRFGKVFQQTYTRFLDLQKAEAQAREAKIENALEKVRSRTMAMQKSGELAEAATVLFQQVKALGVPQWTCGFGIFEIDDKEFTWYPGSADGDILPPVKIPLTEHPVFISFNESRKRGDELFVYEKEGEFQAGHYRYMQSLPGVGEMLQKMLDAGLTFPTFQIDHVANFSHGNLVFITYEHFPEMHDIFKRFAKVFEQTYTRFLDLQKAEAQARESQIQLALERVRARTMAMQRSDELLEAASLLFKQIADLGTRQWSSGFDIWNANEVSAVAWMTNPDGSIGVPFTVPYTEDPFFQQIYAAKERGEDFFVMESSGKELEETYNYLFNLPEAKLHFDGVKSLGFQMPKFQITHCAFFSQGYLMFITFEPAPEMWDIFKRFGKVFEQTYTRFLDLQKAEAQAREAQIETALEKVRSRSLAMHKSDELQEVVDTVFERLKDLNIEMDSANIAIFKEGSRDYDYWIASPFQKRTASFHMPYIDLSLTKDIIAARESGTDFSITSYSFDEKNEWFEYAFENTDFKFLTEERKQFILNAPGITVAIAFSKNTGVQVNRYSGKLLSEREAEILKRFSKVFEQAYIRFNDLQKAEAQAREAQIEAALERVRSKAMAMHKSEDLNPAVATVFDELNKLDLGMLRCGIGILYKDKRTGDVWTTAKSGEGNTIQTSGDESMDIHPLLQGAFDAWQRQGDFSYVLEGEDLVNYYQALTKTNFQLPESASFDTIKEDQKQFYYVSSFESGTLFAFREKEFSEEARAVMKRFANVFNLTYKRFLDIQKAEAQARQAQIETAMEKVRARALAMQKPEELIEVAQVLRKEMGLLGVEELETSSIYIHDEASGTMECWYAIQDIRGKDKKLVTDHMTIHLNDTWVGRQMLKFYVSNQKQTSILMQGENRKEWINYCAQHSEVLQGYYGDVIPERTYHLLKFSNGYIGAASPGNISAESWDLLKRATTVFSLAYTRFNDLQIAEASTKEAVKQSALDRIRADIASMRTISDLDRITPLIWNELTVLGVPFIRCGVFIMDEDQELIHTFLSTPDGKAIGAFHLPYATPGNIQKVLNHWHSKKSYIDHWDESAFTEFADILIKQGALASPEQYLKTIPHGGFYLHFLPFLQGMLYVGNTTQLGEDEIKLIQSVADAFSTAYARYEDFNKLEAAKKQVDSTLTELQVTQKQLIQSEKMASLGELTAGIAHEIQNPLNFVNNFSEVSSELLDEMITELSNDNKEDAIAIADDVKQNLGKILHHGKRADGIVKGMLQHSRSSSATKEPTDINKLADEYLRLAYHGLRAKDKSFNATMKTDYDETIGNINIIPQDIGRAILNLITNAFYVVDEKKKQLGDGYEPTVAISTKKIGDKVEIKVKDNGNGIPQKVLDKIFQPFFTTKPTGQGTGLGLSLSYDIIKAHGGEIKVETKQEEGTTFIIQLPII